MKNFVQIGNVLPLPAPYDVLSGRGLKVGDLFAVASTDALSGQTVEGALEGVFDLRKVMGQAWTVGQKVYWDDTNKITTSTASGNMEIGRAAAAAANPSSTGRVRLCP
ncbi:DUF2190 family protein [Marinivivus vitaminiproducens]|uniref:DUF2190 family protein n=1 Tax=Marinivivus vitaminiproducens TaxID=3035935 RepID=UPI00279E37F7|nr:DUF2190 family protein [Geminicoccaceae bacterium SCSIO 64248]